MNRTTVLRSLEVWLFIAVASTMNGMFRSLFLVPRLGEHMAHVLSVLILIIVILLSSSVLVNKVLKEYANSDLFLIGVLWVVLSVGVDFVFEHYLLKVPWTAIFHDYNLFSGRIWICVLTTEFIGPWFMATDKR